jgi:1,4-alpha-glucan branching enzyme
MVSVDEFGRSTFRVFLPEAQRVELLGDFTGWERSPIVMTRTGDGWWGAEVGVEHGEHTFQYLVDGRVWLADYAAQGVSVNGFGVWVSHLVVLPALAGKIAPAEARADAATGRRAA